MSDCEEIVAERGSRSGVAMGVAVHSTVLGPALGGARMWHYANGDRALADAMRLAEAMSHKAAAAGLALGGGKGVIATPDAARPEGELRRAILLDFGDLVDSLEGRYVTAEDVGTGAEDMAVIASRTDHVVGLSSERGGSGDPSPVTALGVHAAMRACARHLWRASDLGGRRVVLIGYGHVGSNLARLLRADGAEVIVTDLDPGRRDAALALGAEWVDVGEALGLPCDVLAPCALGAIVDRHTIPRLNCEVICGAANNVLDTEADAERLRQRGITYAPDFIANAGGLISVYGELNGTPHADSLRLAAGIEGTIGAILAESAELEITPLAAARRRSLGRLQAVGTTGASRPAASLEPGAVRMRHSA